MPAQGETWKMIASYHFRQRNGDVLFSLWDPQGNWVRPQTGQGRHFFHHGLSRHSENGAGQMTISFFQTSPEIRLFVPTILGAIVLTVELWVEVMCFLGWATDWGEGVPPELSFPLPHGRVAALSARVLEWRRSGAVDPWEISLCWLKPQRLGGGYYNTT